MTSTNTLQIEAAANVGDPNSDDRDAPVNAFRLKYDELYKLFEQVRFDREDQAQGIFLLLASNVGEISHVMIHTASADSDSALLLLLRNVLETTTKAAYVATDPKPALQNLILSDTVEKIKALQQLPTHMQKDDADLAEAVTRLEKRRDALKASGAKAIGVEGMLRQTGGQNWYPFYRLWSASTHGQLTALESQFLDPANKTKILPEMFRKMNGNDWAEYWNLAGQLIDTVCRAFREPVLGFDFAPPANAPT